MSFSNILSNRCHSFQSDKGGRSWVTSNPFIKGATPNLHNNAGGSEQSIPGIQEHPNLIGTTPTGRAKYLWLGLVFACRPGKQFSWMNSAHLRNWSSQSRTPLSESRREKNRSRPVG